MTDLIAIVPSIADIVHDGYAFSDGNGVMGLGVAHAIKKALGLNKLPGAARVRIGGIKGMLALDPTFETDSIGIRPSMLKFRSPHRILEVGEVAEASVEGSHKLFKEALLVSADQTCAMTF